MAGGQPARAITAETLSFSPRSLEPVLILIPPPPDSPGAKKTVDSETTDEIDSGGDEEGEGFLLPCSKKRRLAASQVYFLEKSFEVENKLEPEKKARLAKQLGLQPRQIAIWFQNRRARYKTKQLEKDYGTLKAKFDELRADYDSLIRDRDSLRQQVASLKEKLLEREKAKEVTVSGGAGTAKSDVVDSGSPRLMGGAGTAKSDVVDLGSPRLMGEFWLETANSVSRVFEPDNYSNSFSQDDEDEDPFKQRLRIFPKLELEGVYGDGDYLLASSCKIEFSNEENQVWDWPY